MNQKNTFLSTNKEKKKILEPVIYNMDLFSSLSSPNTKAKAINRL